MAEWFSDWDNVSAETLEGYFHRATAFFKLILSVSSASVCSVENPNPNAHTVFQPCLWRLYPGNTKQTRTSLLFSSLHLYICLIEWGRVECTKWSDEDTLQSCRNKSASHCYFKYICIYTQQQSTLMLHWLSSVLHISMSDMVHNLKKQSILGNLQHDNVPYWTPPPFPLFALRSSISLNFTLSYLADNTAINLLN